MHAQPPYVQTCRSSGVEMAGFDARANVDVMMPDNQQRETFSYIEPALFRESMARLTAAVHIVTSAGIAGKAGFTATAVCSVSDDPAMLLVCVNKRSNSAPLFSQNGVFCVNTLGPNETKLADIFASRTGIHLDERFVTGEWITLKSGSPVLASAVIAFDCRTIEVRELFSHNIILGAVEAVRFGDGVPLLYHGRAYVTNFHELLAKAQATPV
jgi:flavin reductase (DIM6/NTAB) family NADH-FMN oxidoreductase RutF